MGQAFRCDNPECRKFIDKYEEEKKWSDIKIFLREKEARQEYDEITVIGISSNSYVDYCFRTLCPECTKKLMKFVGLENYEFN